MFIRLNRGAEELEPEAMQAAKREDRKIEKSSQRRTETMSITRHDQSSILSQAVQYGDTVYLAGVVAKNLDKDVKGQTKEILDEIDRLLAQVRLEQVQGPAGPDLGHRHPQPRADERGLDRLGDRKNMPARACVEAKLADPKALVEIMVIAAK